MIDPTADTHNDGESKPESSSNAQHYTGTLKENALLLEIHRKLRKNYTELKDLPALMKEVERQVGGENSQEASHGQRIFPSKILSIAQSRLMVANAVVNLIENVVNVYEEHSQCHGSNDEMAETLLTVLRGSDNVVDLDRRDGSMVSQPGLKPEPL